jgi:DNA polymerase III gamma/tau subunit
MLSIFKGESDSAFVLWTAERTQGIDLIVSDGSRVWHSAEPIDASTKPASRKQEPDEEYIAQLRKALKNDQVDVSSSFDVELRPGEDGLRITVKETIGSTSTKSILFKITLPMVDSPEEGMIQLLSQISAKMQRDALHVATQNKSLAEYAALVETLRNDTREMATLKDKIQDEMIAKMCMLLNCKKREIWRLTQRVAELEAETGNDAQVVDLTATASSAVPVRAKAPAKPKAAPRPPAAAKTAKKVAPAAKKAPLRRKRKVQSSSEEEDSAEDNESESSDGEDQHHAGHDSGGLSDVEDGGSVPAVTQSSASNTMTSPGSNVSTNKRRTGTNSATQSAEKPKAHKSNGAAAVTTSLPTVDEAVAIDDSDEDLLPSKRRKATQQASATQASGPMQSAPSGAAAGKSAPKLTQVPSSQASTGVAGAKNGALSKFYAEDSDEDNAMAYM